MKRSAALIILFIAALTISVPMSGTTAAWATGPRPILWLAWLLITGPFGATGIRLADGFSVLWTGP